MQLTIDDQLIQSAVDEAMKTHGYAPINQLKGRTIGIREFTKKYCYPHGIDWVKTNILYKFKPDWVQNIHPGQGGKFAIFEYDAAQWMQEHRKEIDWNAKV
ncbi:MAG TPA: hypothetical protein DDW47_04010 [Lactobacillus acetotolerans]|nr:hypothetical protein [Lactobacillus acetotolerans]